MKENITLEQKMVPESATVSRRLLLAIFAACLIAFCGLLTETAVNIAFPAIMKEFQIGTAAVQWLTTGNLLVVAMITPLTAFLQRRFRLKSLFICGVLIFLAGSVIAITAVNFPMLLIARIVQGCAMGLAVPIGFTLILTQVPGSRTGTFMGIGALVSAAAPALGPTFGGMVNVVLGWRYIFILLIPVLLIALVIGSFSIEQKSQTSKVPVDVKGMLLIFIAFFFLVFGFSELSAVQEHLLREILCFVIGVIALVLFVRQCKKAEYPLLQLAIFANKKFTFHLFAFFIVNVSILGLAFLLPNYLQIASGLDSGKTGLMMLPGALINAVMAPVGGILLDRIGPKKPIIAGTAVALAGILLLTVFGSSGSVPVIVLSYIVYGIGCGCTFGNTMTNGLKSLPREFAPDGNTAFNTLLQFSGAVGTSVVATILAFSQNSSTGISYAQKTSVGVHYGYLFLVLAAVICLFLQVQAFRKKAV